MDRRARLRAARLYFIADAAAIDRVLPAALAGGIDLFQLRDKALGDDDLLRAAARARALCHEAGALFVVNDRPDLAAAADADGVHVGQDDMPVAQAREIVGEDRLVGLSTHTPAQVDAARRGRRPHRRRAGARDADEGGPPGRRPRPRPPRRRARARAVVRHRRPRRDEPARPRSPPARRARPSCARSPARTTRSDAARTLRAMLEEAPVGTA